MLSEREIVDYVQDRTPSRATTEFGSSEAKHIGEELGVHWDSFGVEQFRLGLNIELEHGRRDPSTDVTFDDPMATGKIALAHLKEIPDYYTRLSAMISEAHRAERRDRTRRL